LQAKFSAEIRNGMKQFTSLRLLCCRLLTMPAPTPAFALTLLLLLSHLQATPTPASALTLSWKQ
jgi:hypothetical protein